MSIPRPSGLKQPSRIGRPSGLPTVRPPAPSTGDSSASTSGAQSECLCYPICDYNLNFFPKML